MFFKTKLSTFNILWLLSVMLNSVSAQKNDCVTPKWEMGRCIPYRDCVFLQQLTEKYGNNLPTDERNYLLNSRCNENAKSVYICCKNSDIIVNETNVSSYESSFDSNGLRILSSVKCGNPTRNGISFGEEVNLAQFPFMALLKYDSVVMPFQCGGSLVTHRFVLTAAHCLVGIVDKLVAVRLGEHDTKEDIDCKVWGSKQICLPAPEDINIEKIIPHPEYSRTRLVNDVGLVKLERNVDFKIHIKPICLPITEQSMEFQKDQKFFIAGWGTTENATKSSVLLKAVIPYQDNEKCQNAFKSIRITQNHICAGGVDRIDTCRGDSGGPLFFLAPYKVANRYVQFGVVSFGFVVCGAENNYPAVYARISDLMPWITKNIDA